MATTYQGANSHPAGIWTKVLNAVTPWRGSSERTAELRRDKAWQEWINFNVRHSVMSNQALGGSSTTRGAPELFSVTLDESHFKPGDTRTKYLGEIDVIKGFVEGMKYSQSDIWSPLRQAFTATFGKGNDQYFENFRGHIESRAPLTGAIVPKSRSDLETIILGANPDAQTRARAEPLIDKLYYPLQTSGYHIPQGSEEVAVRKLRGLENNTGFVQQHTEGFDRLLGVLRDNTQPDQYRRYLGQSAGYVAGLSGQDNRDATASAARTMPPRAATSLQA